jgi:hypothetical protein
MFRARASEPKEPSVAETINDFLIPPSDELNLILNLGVDGALILSRTPTRRDPTYTKGALAALQSADVPVGSPP